MLAPYTLVLSRPGARAFVTAGFLGRVWLSMTSLGIVLLVAGETHRYAAAGAVAATFTVCQSVASPFTARLADRLGQRALLLPAVAVHAVGIIALVVLASRHAGLPALFAAAGPAGLACPPMSSYVRARWAALLGAGRDLETAYALESVLDEVVFVGGPVIVTVLATQVSTVAALVVALVSTVIGSVWLALQPATAPHTADARRHGRSVFVVPGIRLLVVTYLATGMLFGSFDVAMVAFAARHGQRGAAGWLLALIASGSLVGGLVYGARQWRAPLHRRFLVATWTLVAGSLPLTLVPGIPWMALAALTTGVSIAPSLIISSLLVERLAPVGSLTEGMAWLGLALGTGFSLGAPLAGHITDTVGPQTAFLVGVVAAAAAATVALLGRGALAVADRRADRVSGPAVAGATAR